MQAQKSSRTSKFIKRLLQPSNLLLVALWSFFFFLVYYVQVGKPPPPPPSHFRAMFSTSANARSPCIWSGLRLHVDLTAGIRVHSHAL